MPPVPQATTPVMHVLLEMTLAAADGLVVLPMLLIITATGVVVVVDT